MSIVTPLRPAFALGIDPGPTTGIVLLYLNMARLSDGAEFFQCGSRSAGWLLGELLASLKSRGADGSQIRCGMEPFVPGRGPGARMKAGQATRGQVEELAGICAEYGVPVQARNAGMVKPWATDRRLEECGLLALTPGSTHARDGARQALYCAHWDCGYPDPLSRARSLRAADGESREDGHDPCKPAPGSG